MLAKESASVLYKEEEQVQDYVIGLTMHCVLYGWYLCYVVLSSLL